ncbi:MAG: hypothetical protein WDO16_05920 [Bacteroidota bacterium]
MESFKRPAIIQEDFFGRLRYIDFRDASKNYFEGKGHFSPANNETEYLIEADITGPANEQKDFSGSFNMTSISILRRLNP